MSSLEPSPPGSSGGRRRKPAGADSIEGLVAPPPRRKGAKGSRRRKGERKRRGRMLPVLIVALGVAVVALVAVLVMEFVVGGSASAGRAVPASYEIYDSGEATEVLGDREVDPRPLAESEVFERGNDEIDSQGITFTLAAKSLTDNCAEAVWGERVAAALEEADCSQVARAGYTSDDYVGVATMFKLRDTDASQAVAAALEPPEEDSDAEPGFLVPPGEEEPFSGLGGGYSAAEATVNGHYLVVTWVQSLGSTSPEERENLTAPLIALGNFDFPLYRRLLEQENAIGGSEAGTESGTEDAAGTEGAGTETGAGTEGAAGTGTEGAAGTEGTGTEGAGTGPGTGTPVG
ncbi:hypothetical protein HDA32_003656 [Spinactinospora alkalitolerans]|uniref:Uncharacterized protein n=1 Tax=Spinactinospora alkalitolerans TaxID=687207 RepID=A0A852TVM0_9ACTN|nr:hypothetical protein [Spinactinospora alkalitolerans]NYE48536.1 hypothetical protein [Spinactinospora alkalitolerans]